MNLPIYAYWFIAALILLILELATGTFYILVVSLAVAIGGLVALSGGDMTLQLAASGLAGIIGTMILRKTRRARPAQETDNNLDIGQAVQRVQWHKDGTGKAFYRGAEWSAEAASADMPREGTFYIKALRGSTLILTNHKPENQ